MPRSYLEEATGPRCGAIQCIMVRCIVSMAQWPLKLFEYFLIAVILNTGAVMGSASRSDS
jgi:hypothetical protein